MGCADTGLLGQLKSSDVKSNCYDAPGGVAERLNAPVLKTGRGLVPLVGSNPTPTVEFLVNDPGADTELFSIPLIS